MQWQGKVYVGNTAAAFIGKAGDNVAHQHWAHQLTISLEDELEVFSGDQITRAKAVFVPSGIQHQLKAKHSISIYIDPTLDCPLITQQASLSSISSVNVCSLQKVLDFANQQSHHRSLEELLFELALDKPFNQLGHARLSQIVLEMDKSIQQGEAFDKQVLGKHLGLSPDYIAQWFKSETGVSMRSYQKWRRLKLAIEEALCGHDIAQSALAAGFTDQAHLSKAFRAAFGISLGKAIKALQLED